MNLCNPEGFKNEIKELLAKGDIDAFYGRFDVTTSKEESFEKGSDIFNRIIHPLVGKKLKGENLVALDLGYGGGTKIQAALEHFDIVYGIDVHGEADFIIENLSVPKDKEVLLMEGRATDIPMPSEEVDFVYSWAMFCHLGTIDNVKACLSEIYRVLRPGGAAVVFFSRMMRPKNYQLWKEVELDMRREEEHIDGYREGGPLSKVRSVSIVISMWKMVKLAELAGFTVLERTAEWSEGEKRRQYHGQFGVVLQKPKPKSSRKKTSAKPTVRRRKKR